MQTHQVAQSTKYEQEIMQHDRKVADFKNQALKEQLDIEKVANNLFTLCNHKDQVHIALDDGG